MRTKVIVYAALLSLGFVIPAWATPRTLPVSPAQEKEAPLMNEPRQERVTPPVPPRGQMLYENHCMSCHESVVHIRGNHRTPIAGGTAGEGVALGKRFVLALGQGRSRGGGDPPQ